DRRQQIRLRGAIVRIRSNRIYSRKSSSVRRSAITEGDRRWRVDWAICRRTRRRRKLLLWLQGLGFGVFGCLVIYDLPLRSVLDICSAEATRTGLARLDLSVQEWCQR